MTAARQADWALESRRNARSFLLFLLVPLCVAGAIALASVRLGPLAHHMSMHLLLMNLVAPALAVAAFAVFRTPHARWASRWLFLASAAQIAVLWLVHAPPLVLASMTNPYVHLAVQGMLFATALWFWLAILNQGGAERWRAILALLITGKLFCLLAALLVFSPRALYPIYLNHSGHITAGADPLADQYLAGLLMLVICPLTYVFAGVLIAERWLTELRRQDADEISRTVST